MNYDSQAMIARIFLICLICLAMCCDSFAGNLGVGAHGGYGFIKYQEKTAAFGVDREADSRQDAFLFGVSGEYSFPGHDNFFAGITTDFAVGLESRERWRDNGIEIQTNDMDIFGQFYDFRAGYKGNLNNFYYRIYAAGGWDGMHFKRTGFIKHNIPVPGTVTEDFSLWRAGAGMGFGYRLDKWYLDSRASFAYYPKGTVDNSDFPGIAFDTNGTCLDLGAGIAREISARMKFYAGLSYTLLRLDQSDVIDGGSVPVVFPESRTEMFFGVMNLTYAF